VDSGSPSQVPEAPAASRAALRESYFAFLAQEFSTLCLHDEFIFFPRVQKAWDHWFQPPRLEGAFLAGAVSRLRDWLSRLEAWPPPPPGSPEEAEAVLLRQSLNSVIRELGPGGPWETDPFFYLKTASLACAPILSGSPRQDWQNLEKVEELLAGVAALFQWGAGQVRHLSRPGRILREGAFHDARGFFRQTLPEFLAGRFPAGAWRRPWQELQGSLEGFYEKTGLLPEGPIRRGEAGLAHILRAGWGWEPDLDKTAAMLAEEIRESEAALGRFGPQVRPGASWAEALTHLKPSGPLDILELYREETARLWRFWQDSGILPPLTGRVVVAETPIYLRSLRTSASYAAPPGPPEETPGYFYITPRIEDPGYHFRHHRFLSAHETAPGHHLLDALRLSLTAPMPRQYESPLFYEGWACYGETLCLSEGYLNAAGDFLVGWQRRLWRALRGLADLEVHRGRWGLEEARDCLRRAAYPPAAVNLQVLHLGLNPGYQLCYTLGLRELLRLRERYAPALGLARFHDAVLSGGQLPFSLIEKRLRIAEG